MCAVIYSSFGKDAYLNFSGIEVLGCYHDKTDVTTRSKQAGGDTFHLAVQEYLHPYYGSKTS